MTLPIGIVRSYSVATGIPTTRPTGIIGTNLETAGRTTIPYVSGSPITMNPGAGTQNVVTVTDNVALTIAAPTPANIVAVGQRLGLTIRNTSGGALGAATFNAAFKMSAWTNPATATSRSIEWEWDGTNWVQISPTGVDVPN